MATQPETVQLDRETAQALAGYAAELGLTVPEFLRRHFAGTNGPTRIDDADAWLDELADGVADLPPLPRDFSTKDIYADHD
jgi:hypothetical protein